MKCADLISIIVPAYNAEKSIERCIESIQNQTYENIEIIVVNDGSTDKTYEILLKLQEKDKRIILCDKRNEGVSEARNAGLSLAKGEYIGFVDSDDCIDKRMYESLIQRIITDNSDMAICALREYYSKDNIVDIKFIKKDCVLSDREYIRNMSGGIYNAYYGGPGNKLYSKKVCKDILFHKDIFLGEDLIYNIDVLRNVHKISVSSEIFYTYYLDREDSLTKIKYKGSVMWENAKLTYNKYIVLCKNKGIYKENEKDIYYMFACILMFPICDIIQGNMKISDKAKKMKDLLSDEEAVKALDIVDEMSYTWKIIKNNYRKDNYKMLIIKLVILEKIKKINKFIH